MSYIVNLSWHDIDGQSDGMSNIQPEDVNGELSETLNDIDYFDFVVYYGQQNWAHFEPNQTFVDLWSIKQSKDVFNGRCVAVTKEMTNDGILSKRIHCESEMAYLCDSVGDVNDILLHMRTYYPATTEEKAQYGEDYVRFDRFIMSLLSLHTTSTGDVKRRIYANDCTYNSGGYFEPVDPTTPAYPPTDITQSIDIDTGSSWSVLKDLRDRLGYDIWIVHEDGHIVLKISYSGAHMDTHHSPITLGENMQSLRVETSPQEYGKVTRIVPLGGVGANGLRLTIADVNNHERWLTNAASRAIEAKTGIIQKVVVYEDLVDDGNLTADEARAVRLELMRRGGEELSKLTTGITGITCRAVDLYELNVANKHPYQIGGNYPFYCPYLGLYGDDGTYDYFFRLTRRVTDLGKPYDPELTFALPSATYQIQATDERIRVAQKIYALQKSQADRMDGTSVKQTTSAAYDPTTANTGTVYYVDNGTSGQIYLDGKAYGGGGTTVENATVLVPTNFHDFVIEEELILDIQPPNMLYYGRDTAIICVQGHYMLQVGYDTYGAASYDSTLGWVINGSKDTYNAVIANLDKFGSQLGTETEGGFLITRRTSSATSGPAYPEEYAHLNARIASVTGSNATMNRYSVSVDERRASTNTPTGDWWEETMSWGSTTLYTHQQYLKAPDNNNTNAVPNTLQLEAIYLVPVTLPYQTAETYAATIPLQTPYGYTNMQWPIIVAVFRHKSTGDLSYSLTNVDLTGTTNRYRMPLISNAEKCFALGLTKRTEPVVPNGGGT